MDDALPPLNHSAPTDADESLLALAGGRGSGVAPVRPATSPGPIRFQYRVLKALVLREMSAKHGESRLGYLMGIIMPIATLAVLILAFSFRGRTFSTTLPTGTFIVTGYPIWYAFRGTLSRVMGAASRTDPLLMFPQITQLDLILAVIILEVSTNTVVFLLLILGVVLIFHEAAPADPTGVIMLFWACGWIGAALGLILCGITRLAPMLATLIMSFMRFGMWMSGVIFSVNVLPAWTWPYLKWNPILHCIEGVRHLWKPDFEAPIFDPVYIISAGFVLTALGFVLERLTRRFVGP